MHELQVTRSILNTVLEHASASGACRVHRISLQVGELNDCRQEWIQKYFDLISRASIAEGARIAVEKVPASFRCRDCGLEFAAQLQQVDRLRCPACSSVSVSLEHGKEFLIRDMEVT
jgi:hydrogenase nickel incorporation protein HypA/HybF